MRTSEDHSGRDFDTPEDLAEGIDKHVAAWQERLIEGELTDEEEEGGILVTVIEADGIEREPTDDEHAAGMVP